MNIVKKALLLLFTLIVVPVLSFYFGKPLSSLQLDMIFNVGLIMTLTAFICFVVGELTMNNSQVDKIWSVVPIIYVWVMAYQGGFSPRLLLMAIMGSLWGVRLTLNFARRGAYKLRFWEGEEDYRWQVLRKNPMLKGRFRWMLFNLLFICIYQNTLILLITLPMIPVISSSTPLFWADYLISAGILLLLIAETVADHQQWIFQKEKHRQLEANEKSKAVYAKGFLAEGLWRYVRHPNYAAEQGIWIAFYLYSIAATGLWVNWSVAGCLLLVILFQMSSEFSEDISSGKYKRYKDYVNQVPRFVPWPGKKWRS